MTASVDGVDLGSSVHVVRDPRGDVRVHAERRAALPRSTAKPDPDPRRRVGVGHAAAPGAGSCDDQLMYVRDMGLNTVRLEGKLESDHFFDEADRLGILVMPGWMCCDYWQESWKWTRRRDGDRAGVDDVAGAPDAQPPERVHVPDRQRHEARPGRPADVREGAARTPMAEPDPGVLVGRHVIGARADRREDDRPVRLGPARVLVRPRARRAAPTGFNTETSAGSRSRELENLRRMLSPDELTRALDGAADAAVPRRRRRQRLQDVPHLRPGDDGADGRADEPRRLRRKAQVMAYENERAMFEAFSRNKYASTGVIQWMLNNAWPSLHWNLFDWFLEPNGSTFGAKIANEPLHVQYSYDDRSVAVVNQTLERRDGVDGGCAGVRPGRATSGGARAPRSMWRPTASCASSACRSRRTSRRRTSWS